jgi:hypothetical protein
MSTYNPARKDYFREYMRKKRDVPGKRKYRDYSGSEEPIGEFHLAFPRETDHQSALWAHLLRAR